MDTRKVFRLRGRLRRLARLSSRDPIGEPPALLAMVAPALVPLLVDHDGSPPAYRLRGVGFSWLILAARSSRLGIERLLTGPARARRRHELQSCVGERLATGRTLSVIAALHAEQREMQALKMLIHASPIGLCAVRQPCGRDGQVSLEGAPHRCCVEPPPECHSCREPVNGDATVRWP